MRFLLRVSIPTDTGNELAINGRLGSTLEALLKDIKPEAAYFTEMDGERTAIIVVEMTDASQIPAIAEPFFLALDAIVEFHPCMSPEDLNRAGPAIERAVAKYGAD